MLWSGRLGNGELGIVTDIIRANQLEHCLPCPSPEPGTIIPSMDRDSSTMSPEAASKRQCKCQCPVSVPVPVPDREQVPVRVVYSPRLLLQKNQIYQASTVTKLARFPDRNLFEKPSGHPSIHPSLHLRSTSDQRPATSYLIPHTSHHCQLVFQVNETTVSQHQQLTFFIATPRQPLPPTDRLVCRVLGSWNQALHLLHVTDRRRSICLERLVETPAHSLSRHNPRPTASPTFQAIVSGISRHLLASSA